MKKVLNIVLLFILALTMVSCGTSSLLKNSLSEGAGFGDILFKNTDFKIKTSLITTDSALQFTNIKFKVDDKVISRQDELLKNLKSGTRKINVEITNNYNDGEGIAVLTGEKSVVVGVNQIVAVGNFELSNEKLYGSITATTAGLTIAGSVTEGSLALEPTKAQFKIGTTVKKFGEKLKDLETDKEVTITVEVPSDDGKTIYFTELKRTLTEAKLLTLDNITLDKAKAGRNAYKFILTEAKYNTIKSGTINFSDITKVTLRGGMNSWESETPTYQLYKSGNEWIGYFPVNEGTEFKFAVNNEWTSGGNITVSDASDFIESALVWQFKLTEAKYNTIKSGTINFSDITKVTLRGGMNSWESETPTYQLYKSGNEWIGYFPVNEGTEFKFAVNNEWTGGGNITVSDASGVTFK